jgi:hypothetical protein
MQSSPSRQTTATSPSAGNPSTGSSRSTIPANARPNYAGDGWICRRGYRRSGSGCARVIVPANASLSSSGSDWICIRGYRRSGSGCVPVAVQGSGASRSSVSSSNPSSVGLGGQPSLTGLNTGQQALVRSSCSSAERNRNTSVYSRDQYYDCLTRNIANVRGLGGQPSLTGLNTGQQALVRSSCSSAERNRNTSVYSRDQYYDCLRRNIKRIRGGRMMGNDGKSILPPESK